MNVISSIIHLLTDDEKKEFIKLLKKKNKRHDTKNITLFHILENSGAQSNVDILLYDKPAKGAYHALCKRLQDSLIEFIAFKSFDAEASEEMETLKLLIASRVFFEQKQYKLALKTINKATLKAKKYDLYSVLNEIYYTKIQYAEYNDSTSLAELILAFKNNKKLLEEEENLNLFYATIQQELKKVTPNINEIITENLEKFEISITKNLSFKSLFKILSIVNHVAAITRNYSSILSFVEETYKLLNTEKRLSEKQNFYHIQVLYYIANTYFRNRNFEESKEYLKLMLKQMEFENRKLYNRFLPQYFLLIALNFNYTDNSQHAIALIENFDFHKYRGQVAYILDLQLCLTVFYFQQLEFKKALFQLNELHHSDAWYIEKAGLIWVIKKAIIEILLQIELDNFDIVESRLKSFKKKYNVLLITKKETQIINFVRLVTQFYFYPEKKKEASFNSEIKQFITTLDFIKGDIFTLSFYAWFKAKIEGTNLYKTTLSIVNQTSKNQVY